MPALYELHWLPIQSRIQFKLCLLVHHVIGGRSPAYISELVNPVAHNPGRASLRSADRQELVVPRSRLVSSERAFAVAAPKAWNRLPVYVKSTRDTGSFKKQLTTFFILDCISCILLACRIQFYTVLIVPDCSSIALTFP